MGLYKVFGELLGSYSTDSDYIENTISLAEDYFNEIVPTLTELNNMYFKIHSAEPCNLRKELFGLSQENPRFRVYYSIYGEFIDVLDENNLFGDSLKLLNEKSYNIESRLGYRIEDTEILNVIPYN